MRMRVGLAAEVRSTSSDVSGENEAASIPGEMVPTTSSCGGGAKMGSSDSIDNVLMSPERVMIQRQRASCMILKHTICGIPSRSATDRDVAEAMHS